MKPNPTNPTQLTNPIQLIQSFQPHPTSPLKLPSCRQLTLLSLVPIPSFLTQMLQPFYNSHNTGESSSVCSDVTLALTLTLILTLTNTLTLALTLTLILTLTNTYSIPISHSISTPIPDLTHLFLIPYHMTHDP